MSPTGLAFAGVGWLGESLIKELPGVPELELTGVQDARLELAREVSAKYGGVWFGSQYTQLLALPGVDGVVICTPNALHVPQAAQALRAGKHVLVQKPLALSFAEARWLIDLARDAERMLFVDYTYRFLETIAALRQALARLGQVRAVTAQFHNLYGPGAEKTWFFDRKLSGGGALLDLGVHLLDLALWLFQPHQVSLEEARLVRGGIEREAELRVRLDAEVPFDLAVSWNAPLAQTRIAFDIDAEHGRLRWENVDGSFFRFRTVLDHTLLIERETTLRIDTLRAFAVALKTSDAPAVDARVYALLDQAYATDDV
ncbi:MAG: Gfo/Idh/MocA family oxidoreductase [Chloroflexota bacterium]|nr:Gfo/Idh/MocA family oxidoreductase [Chloroflexota bacterium]